MSADLPKDAKRHIETADTRTVQKPASGLQVDTVPSDESQWAARLVCAGSLLTLLFEVAYLGLDRRFLSTSNPRILVFHAINIGLFLVAALMALKVAPWTRRHWKPVALGFSSAMIASTTGISVVAGETEPLFITLMLFLSGTGPFLSWGEKYQTLLSMVAIVALAVATSKVPDRPPDPYQWLGILIAAAIGLFSTALLRRVRRARRHAEEKLRESRTTLIAQERMRIAGQLASGIAHDLNNTLNVIKLRLSILLQDDGLMQRHGERLREIDRAIDDSARTVLRVRELGNIRTGSQTESAQLHDVISQAIDLARPSIEGKSLLNGAPIEIQFEIARQLPQVKGAASDLRQVFLNLLLNASDAMPNGGKIRIDAAAQADTVVVRVSDEGSGIPIEPVERIFEPFFTTKGTRGTGLGLSIAREILEGLGGSISVQNRAGGGALFALTFPIAAAVLPESKPTVNGQISRGCRFLLVDDDAQNLDALREALVLLGHHVDTALSGVEALEKLQSGLLYQVVLCDLAMPGMNGWEVARKALEIAPNLEFYIATGWGGQFEVETPSGPPVSGVLSKPINLVEIEQIAAKIRARA